MAKFTQGIGMVSEQLRHRSSITKLQRLAERGDSLASKLIGVTVSKEQGKHSIG